MEIGIDLLFPKLFFIRIFNFRERLIFCYLLFIWKINFRAGQIPFRINFFLIGIFYFRWRRGIFFLLYSYAISWMGRFLRIGEYSFLRIGCIWPPNTLFSSAFGWMLNRPGQCSLSFRQLIFY